MKRTAFRLGLLRRAAVGDPATGHTDSPILTELINQHLIECAGLDYRLTPAGADLLEKWETEMTTTANDLAARLAHRPDIRVQRARRLLRCVGADPNSAVRIELTSPDVAADPDDAHITGRVHEETGPDAATNAERYAARLAEREPGAAITITGVPNRRFRPTCRGDIRPGELFAQPISVIVDAQPWQCYCADCAIATWAERDVNR